MATLVEPLQKAMESRLDPVVYPAMPPLLEVRNICKRFGASVALDGLSFHVDAGERFGLLGPNGAGKTTLLSIIAGLTKSDAGEVLLDGQAFHPGRRDLLPRLGVVPQDLAIYPELTAAENLRFFAKLFGIHGKQQNAAVGKLLELAGLTDRADHRVATFSGGMKRRLNLAAALVHGPKLLLLDEPTTGVDPQSRARIFDGIRQLNEDGMTVIYTSHYMEEVQALCPRIGIMDQGRLVACDVREALLRRLPGKIRLRSEAFSAELVGQLRKIADIVVQEPKSSGILEMETANAQEAIIAVTRAIHEAGQKVTACEMESPNLERVFLYLTGHELRD